MEIHLREKYIRTYASADLFKPLPVFSTHAPFSYIHIMKASFGCFVLRPQPIISSHQRTAPGEKSVLQAP